MSLSIEELPFELSRFIPKPCGTMIAWVSLFWEKIVIEIIVVNNKI